MLKPQRTCHDPTSAICAVKSDKAQGSARLGARASRCPSRNTRRRDSSVNRRRCVIRVVTVMALAAMVRYSDVQSHSSSFFNGVVRGHFTSLS